MREIESNAPLTLPPDLHAALRTLSERLEGYISRRHVVLGGGTVLAMRYRHRISTDIDLFFPIGLSETLASQHGDELWERNRHSKWRDGAEDYEMRTHRRPTRCRDAPRASTPEGRAERGRFLTGNPTNKPSDDP